MEAFSSAYGQGLTEFEKMVRYELTALAQLRVINGYGLGSKEGAKGTASIITEKDVQNAVNIATILLERKYFRTVDPVLLAQLNTTDADSKVTTYPESRERRGLGPGRPFPQPLRAGSMISEWCWPRVFVLHQT